MFQLLAAGGSIHNLEMETRTRSGESKSVLVNAERIELNGKACVLSMIEDITDRKRAEAALRASEERYRLIAENTSDVIWLYDLAADKFSYVSPAIHSLLGYRPEEMLVQNMHVVLTPVGAENVRRALENRLAEFAAGKRARSSAVVEVEQTHKDGRIVSTEVVASILTDATGRPTHILGVSRDITERRRAQATLEKFNSELEQRVEQRTAELATRNNEIQALLDSIPDAVLLCDSNGTVISSHSPSGHESLAPSTSRDPLGDQDPALREIAREMHALSRSGNETVVREFDRPGDGSTLSIEARATPPALTACSSSCAIFPPASGSSGTCSRTSSARNSSPT